MYKKKILKTLDFSMGTAEKKEAWINIVFNRDKTFFNVQTPKGFKATLTYPIPIESASSLSFHENQITVPLTVFCKMIDKTKMASDLFFSIKENNLICTEELHKKDGTTIVNTNTIESISKITSVLPSCITFPSQFLASIATLNVSSIIKNIPQLDGMTFTQDEKTNNSYVLATIGSVLHFVQLDIPVGKDEKVMSFSYANNFALFDKEVKVGVLSEGMLVEDENLSILFPWKIERKRIYSKLISLLSINTSTTISFFKDKKEYKEFDKKVSELRKKYEKDNKLDTCVHIHPNQPLQVKVNENTLDFSIIPFEGISMTLPYYDFNRFISHNFSVQFGQTSKFWMMRNNSRGIFGKNDIEKELSN